MTEHLIAIWKIMADSEPLPEQNICLIPEDDLKTVYGRTMIGIVQQAAWILMMARDCGTEMCDMVSQHLVSATQQVLEKTNVDFLATAEKNKYSWRPNITSRNILSLSLDDLTRVYDGRGMWPT